MKVLGWFLLLHLVYLTQALVSGVVFTEVVVSRCVYHTRKTGTILQCGRACVTDSGVCVGFVYQEGLCELLDDTKRNNYLQSTELRTSWMLGRSDYVYFILLNKNELILYL